MEKFFILFLFLALQSTHLPAQSAKPPQAPRPLVLTHVTVLDATGAPAQSDRTVVITGNRITELGPSASVQVPKDAQVIDARGKFLIPGLWDMHAHWYQKDYLPLFVANGVTGIRIMGGAPAHHQWRQEIEQGELLGPRMAIASPFVDGPRPSWSGFTSVKDAAEGRQVVIRSKQESADFIKVHNRLPREIYLAIMDEAKRQGIPVAGHVPEPVPVAEASDAGQQSIEHFTKVLEACSTREEELRKRRQELWTNLPEGQTAPSRASLRELTRLTLETFSPDKANALFARLARNHTWQCPTLTTLRNFASLDDPRIHSDPRVKYMPPGTTGEWNPANDVRVKDWTAEDYELSRTAFRKHSGLIVPMRRAGVEFLAGTDVLNPYCFPGFSLHDELELFVEAGLSPLEALQTATLNPARFLGKEKDLGTIEKGKIADLVLLEASPLENIGNSRKIDAVVVNGMLFRKRSSRRCSPTSRPWPSRSEIAPTGRPAQQASGTPATGLPICQGELPRPFRPHGCGAPLTQGIVLRPHPWAPFSRPVGLDGLAPVWRAKTAAPLQEHDLAPYPRSPCSLFPGASVSAADAAASTGTPPQKVRRSPKNRPPAIRPNGPGDSRCYAGATRRDRGGARAGRRLYVSGNFNG